MDAQVAALLIARCKNDQPAVTAREILAVLKRPVSDKSELNRILYKTEKALVPEDNLLGLPEHYRLVSIRTGAPVWRVVPNCSPEILARPAAVDAWHAYAMLRARPNTAISVAELLAHRSRDRMGRDYLAAEIRASMLTVHEHIESHGDHALILRVADPAVDDTVELDCDKLLDATRTHVQCVVLGMAIMECVVANRTKKVVLVTANPGTRSILRSVLKTNEYVRALNVGVSGEELLPQISHE